MGLRASLKIAKRALVRRKTKNLSAILAITLGVTLMVGIQITTDTLENAFLTSLLVTEGEVDIRVTNATGSYLTAADEENISSLVENELAIMSELTSYGPAMVGSQFEPVVEMAGIPLDFPSEFGSFYDWQSEDAILEIDEILVDNTSILLSSHLAEDLGLNKSTELPVDLRTEFTNITLTMMINLTTGFPVINTTTGFPIFIPVFATERINLSIAGIFDSRRPGIGASYRGILFSMEGLQDWVSLNDIFRKKDIISAYLITFKSNHFETPIKEDFLQEQFDDFEEVLPEKMIEGKITSVYAIDSARLQYIGIIDLIFNMMSAFLNVLGLLIIITGVLLITNVQLMSVEDREFQTGVLRAVGEKRRGIFYSMLVETLFQGIIGGLLGLFGGLLFGQTVALYLVSLFGSGRASVQPIVQQNVMIFSVMVGVILGIITGLLPALRASRVNIVEALRGIKIMFQEKSSRNLVIVGILLVFIGAIFLLNNGFFNEELQYIWETTGWDNIEEWENILLGAGFLFSGLGIILSRYISRTKAFNLSAIVLWLIPVFMFVVAMGEGWISDMSGEALDILIISIVEIVVGSVLLVGMNLSPLMRFLRGSLIKISGLKGVAQVAPALISSHKTRSTLTFAIFAVVLTLNVTVASLVATNIESSVGQSEDDSRGIDLIVTLSKPETVLEDTSYSEELYELDSSITDIIGMKTFTTTTDYTKFVATKDPFSPEYNPQSHLLPIGFGELRPEQIRGDAKNASEDDWRYDFYLTGFPDGVRPPGMISSGMGFGGGAEYTDEELLDLSKEAWDVFFDPAYKMSVYNITFDLETISDLDFSRMSQLFSQDLDEIETLNLTNPIVFTDSFILPIGMQIWIPMNTSNFGFPIYQPFTIGGKLDSNRAGGFPLSSSGFAGGFSSDGFGSQLGNLYIPERFSQYSNFFGEADGVTPISRAPDQFDAFLIKTDYAIDDPAIEEIARKIEEFTNTEKSGYRKLINDEFIVVTATSLYSKLEAELEMMEQMTNFLQIYVNFGLVIGAVGMAVISVRNVAERKREIGMMRAIGFPRLQVMLAALLELLVLGIIGLFIGVVNGLFINVGFANMLNVPVVIPWGTIGFYLSLITFIGLLAGAIPGWVASRIPAAEALRYVG
ncbi:MAG: FtsX-like permease family protein [Candidatus Heimdallarchaeota archaeon]|nr:MAG: FtsX-like permease family protein [Candidatus Heimdallarchaeota archaeon]